MPRVYKYYKGTKAGGLKASATNREKHGEDFYQRIGRIGGKAGHTGGFAANPELARIAGAKGGKISKRGPAKNKPAKKKVAKPTPVEKKPVEEPKKEGFFSRLIKK